MKTIFLVVGYNCLIFNKRQWNNCFIKFSTSVIIAEFFAIFLDKTFASRRKHHGIQLPYKAKSSIPR